MSASSANAFTVKKSDLRCIQDEDCVIVNNSCTSYVAAAAAKKAAERYEELHKKECRNSTGPATSLAVGGPFTVKCEKRLCRLHSESGR